MVEGLQVKIWVELFESGQGASLEGISQEDSESQEMENVLFMSGVEMEHKLIKFSLVYRLILLLHLDIPFCL